MTRSINISLGENDYEWRKAALDFLASDVITDAEAGQRGKKLSVMIQMLATAAIANGGETARLMLEIKRLTEKTRE
jgi:hypothetical protein